MNINNKNIINLDLKKDEKILDFSDFQKQNIKFDISKLQESYNQIVQTKKFDDGGGIAHFGAISLTQIPGDPDSIKGNKARGVYWTKPDKSGKEVVSEEFSYLALDFIAKAEKQYQPSTFPSKELRIKTETVESYFTVQVCSKPDKKEAISESDKLFDFGFEDVYIEEYLHENTTYWRVRTGIFNSKIKANKRKEEVSKKLKIKPQDLWAVEVK